MSLNKDRLYRISAAHRGHRARQRVSGSWALEETIILYDRPPPTLRASEQRESGARVLARTAQTANRWSSLVHGEGFPKAHEVEDARVAASALLHGDRARNHYHPRELFGEVHDQVRAGESRRSAQLRRHAGELYVLCSARHARARIGRSGSGSHDGSSRSGCSRQVEESRKIDRWERYPRCGAVLHAADGTDKDGRAHVGWARDEGGAGAPKSWTAPICAPIALSWQAELYVIVPASNGRFVT